MPREEEEEEGPPSILEGAHLSPGGGGLLFPCFLKPFLAGWSFPGSPENPPAS